MWLSGFFFLFWLEIIQFSSDLPLLALQIWFCHPQSYCIFQHYRPQPRKLKIFNFLLKWAISRVFHKKLLEKLFLLYFCVDRWKQYISHKIGLRKACKSKTFKNLGRVTVQKFQILSYVNFVAYKESNVLGVSFTIFNEWLIFSGDQLVISAIGLFVGKSWNDAAIEYFTPVVSCVNHFLF